MPHPDYPFLAASPQPNTLGLLQHFRVDRLIGAGGMGYVFEATDTRLQRPVALKVIKPEMAIHEGSHDRFLREARAMASIRHEHVVTVYDVGQQGRFPFLAMELLEGETLSGKLVDSGPLPWQQAVSLTRQICLGLQAAHATRIIHRDIKPTNIWLQAPGDAVRILDFGLARGDEYGLTQTGRLLGTPRYLSPEQARSEPVDRRSDLYSVGVTLYEMLTGRLPHDEPTIARQLAAVVAKRPTPVEQLRPDVPRELSQLVRGLLQKQPDRRPDDAAAVIHQLDDLSERAELTIRGSATSLSDSRRRRTKRQTPSWVRSFSRPQSWLVLAAFLFPGLLTYQFADRIFPLRVDSQPLTQTFPPGELSEALPTIAERQEETITLVCGAVANSLFAVGAQGRAASSDYVNLAYQPTYVRSSPVMPFEVSALPADRRCVDALLTLTLKGGATSSGQRTVSVYAVDRDAENVDSQAVLQRLMESGAAISLGQWTFDNAGYRRNGVPDGISFSSSRLIDFLNNAESDVVTLFLWRQDASNGQTHIYADPAKPELLPKLWLQLAGP